MKRAGVSILAPFQRAWQMKKKLVIGSKDSLEKRILNVLCFAEWLDIVGPAQ